MFHTVGSKVFKVSKILEINHRPVYKFWGTITDWYLIIKYKELKVDFDSGFNFGVLNESSLYIKQSNEYEIKLPKNKCINHINEIKMKMLFHNEELKNNEKLYNEKYANFIKKLSRDVREKIEIKSVEEE